MEFKNENERILELKKEIDSYRPFPKEVLDKLGEFYRIGFTYTSNALEGNSLSESETKVIIEDGITIGGKTIREHNEVLGHSEAYTMLELLAKNTTITEENILELHRLFYYRIDEKKAGVYRQEQVFISGTDYLPPPYQEIQKLMKDFICEIPKMKSTMQSVTFCAYLHERLVTIHPFIDGNGRTARLVMNMALMQSGYPIIIIPPVLRGEYIEKIRLANKGQVQPFYDFISSVEYESAKDYLRLLKHFFV
ncbi:MAG: Fic family protein [Termitinemataceae bacterium]|nr:MAG: Fic family protein [Termitinemataceae bacterium]